MIPARFGAISVLFLVVFVSPAVRADSLAACDSLYRVGDVEGSEILVRAVLQDDPADYEAAWRLSRSRISAGNLAESRDESRRCFEEARDMANLAIELNPQGTSGYTCLAAVSYTHHRAHET